MSLEGEKKTNKKREGVETDETKNYTSYCLLLLERSWTSVPKLVVWIFFSLVAVVFVCVCFFLLGLCHFYGQL